MYINSAHESIPPANRQPERPWRTCEAAAWAGTSERYLLDLARAGILPAKKISGTWWFSPSKLAEFFGVDGGDR